MLAIEMYQCHYCNKTYSTKRTLTAHVYKIHEKEDRWCCKCGVLLIIDNTSECNKNRKNYVCRTCHNDGQHQRWLKTKEKVKQTNKKHILKIRKETVDAYGGKCECCLESNFRFLTIDHINNDGKEERKKLGLSGGYGFYKWLISNGFPDRGTKYQVLCWNCQLGKKHFGTCPHKELTSCS